MAPTKLSFEARVQALPAEIFEEIFNLTMTLDSDTVSVDEHYKPPVQLSIDRASHRAFAAEYYSATTFHIKYPDTPRYDSPAEVKGETRQIRKTTEDWLQSLPLQHLQLLENIRVDRMKLRAETSTYNAAVSARVQLHGFFTIAWNRWRGTLPDQDEKKGFPWTFPAGVKTNLLIGDEERRMKEAWWNVQELFEPR